MTTRDELIEAAKLYAIDWRCNDADERKDYGFRKQRALVSATLIAEAQEYPENGTRLWLKDRGAE